MPQNIPYPGETEAQFQQRMRAQQAGQGRDGPFIPSNLSPDRPFFGEAGMPDFLSNMFSREGVQYTNPASNMAVNPTGNPVEASAVSNPANSSFDLGAVFQNAQEGAIPFFDMFLGPRSSAANMGVGPYADWKPGDPIGVHPETGEPVYEHKSLANFPQGEAWYNNVGGLDFIKDWIPGWPDRNQPAPEAPAQPPQPGRPFGGPAQTADSQAGAGTMTQDSTGFQRDMYSPIPPSGEDVIDDSPMPQLRREQVEEFIRQMEGTAPGEFERDDVDGSRILTSMGQALAGAGQAPTVGEALLSLGTGGTSAVAQHEEEQRQLEREHSENQREFQRQLAEQAFAGEQALLQSEQQAHQFDLKMDQAIAQQDAARMEALGRQSGLKVSGDNIVITKPKLDEDGNPTNQTSVEVISTKEQDGFLDAAAMGGSGENVSLPSIGGLDLNKTLAGAPMDAQADIVTSANLTVGSIPMSRIQEPRVQQRIQQIRQQAEQKVISKYAGENEIESITELAGMKGVDIGDIQDEVERAQWKATMEEMGRNPVVRYSIWQASGNPQLRRIADPALQQYREQFDNGSQ